MKTIMAALLIIAIGLTLIGIRFTLCPSFSARHSLPHYDGPIAVGDIFSSMPDENPFRKPSKRKVVEIKSGYIRYHCIIGDYEGEIDWSDKAQYFREQFPVKLK